MTSTKKGGREVLKFVMCLQILSSLNNRSIFADVSELVGGSGLYVVCMIPNIKTYFYEIVTFLALVLVL